MGAGSRATATDQLRKGVIIALLVAAVVALYRFGPNPLGFDTRGLMVLGFVVLAAYTFGELVEIVRLPHITGYLLAGLLLGPSLWHVAGDTLHLPLGLFADGFMSPAVIDQFQPLEALALALIAMTAGGELKISELREDAKGIVGVLTGQTLAIFASVLGLIVAISGVIPAIQLDALAGVGLPAAIALGAVVASVSIATSPAATIAVINDAKANQGPLARVVLSTVVLKDVLVVVLFSLCGTWAGIALGLGGNDAVAMSMAWHVLGSIAIGALIGGGIAVYLQSVGVEALLFLVGVIFTSTLVANQVHLDPALLFIAAGFTTSNFTRAGDKLIHSLEQLSLPVYVVFFTLAGAKLHLDTLATMLPFALALVGVRMAALYVGVRAGARAAGTHEATARHGWMGFVSQAGVAITLAGLVGSRFGEPGVAIETLIIAGVAIHEVIGPVMLKIALSLAGEIPDDEPEEVQAPIVPKDRGPPPDPADVPSWAEPEEVQDAWGEPVSSLSPRLDTHAADLELDLQSIVQDLTTGPLDDRTQAADAYLRELRRAFLRHHRRVDAASRSGQDVCVALRRACTQLVDDWREIVLARAAALPLDTWSPATMLDVLDGLVDTLPAELTAPIETESFETSAEESPLQLLRRGGLLSRRALARFTGTPLERTVPLRTLARYHMADHAAGDLEGAAAVLIRAEIHLAARTGSLYDGIARLYDELSQRTDDPDLAERLDQARLAAEEAFSFARDELHHVANDAANRVTRVLGASLVAFKQDLLRVGTPDLPASSRRLSLVYRRRTRGQEALGARFEEGQQTAVARYALLALELELMGLEGKIREALDDHGSHLARQVKGRGSRQLERVIDALETSLAHLDEHLDEPDVPADRLAASLRQATVLATQLSAELAEERVMEPLLDELIRSVSGLTEHYVVPTGRLLEGDWSLPPPATRTEVPFRLLVLDYIETQVTRDLIKLARGMVPDVQRVAGALDELGRVVAFNVELAASELDVLHSEPVPDETRMLVRDMVVGALRRNLLRLNPLLEDAEQWPETVRAELRAAVLDDLEALRATIVDGRASEVRLRLRAAAGRRLREASRISGQLQGVRAELARVTAAIIGAERLDAARVALGLPDTRRAAMADTERFAPPQSRAEIPLVYRRLFSEQALEVGDLLTGRHSELARCRAALAVGSRLRAVAVIGVNGVGKGAVVNALARTTEAKRVHRIELTRPTSVQEVATWFDHPDGGHLTVIQGVRWLVAARPGGLDPIRRLVDGVLADGGRNAWVIAADRAVWRHVERIVPLADSFPEVIVLDPLTRDELESAILARHAMSGYELNFSEDLDWRHLLSRGRAQAPERRRARWFDQLHRATGGVVNDALRLWMAAILKVDDAKGSVVSGPVPRTPDQDIEALPDDTLLTLRQICTHGWTDPTLHAAQFRVSSRDAAAHLAHLEHNRLVEQTEGVYRVAEHLQGAVQRVLARRGWLE